MYTFKGCEREAYTTNETQQHNGKKYIVIIYHSETLLGL
jgi:hypothetical protein